MEIAPGHVFGPPIYFLPENAKMSQSFSACCLKRRHYSIDWLA
jgi:hypothetical protein